MSEGESILLRPQLPWLPWVFTLLATGTTLGLAWALRGEVIGWVTFAVLAGPAILTGARFHPDCHTLKLGDEGVVVTRWFRPRVHGWEQIQGVEVCFGGGMKRVEIVKLGPEVERVVLNGSWQMSPDALAVLLRRWQARRLERWMPASPSV